jgi:fatty acyl-CoA reductase
VLSEFDWRWALGQPRGNAWVRFGSWCVTKFLRRAVDEVTVDLPSFERARLATPEGSAFVLVPSHRSYLDFVLCSYLAFARPDLGFPIPHIAATMEFGKIPLLGRLLSAMHAFYLRRGQGKEDPELTRRVRELIESGHALEFFPEGARSRTREWLPPRRGLMRALQGTGKPCALLPISISFDRLPEERSFLLELTGHPKPPMELRTFLRWAARAWRGELSLGRIHIACGAPVLLDASSDVHQVADAVMTELKGAMAITTFHLEAYLRHFPIPGHDAASLKRLIESRGGRVLASSLHPDDALPAPIARTMREHFAAYLDQVESPVLEHAG